MVITTHQLHSHSIGDIHHESLLWYTSGRLSARRSHVEEERERLGRLVDVVGHAELCTVAGGGGGGDQY